jgi:hypothetical protein
LGDDLAGGILHRDKSIPRIINVGVASLIRGHVAVGIVNKGDR